MENPYQRPAAHAPRADRRDFDRRTPIGALIAAAILYSVDAFVLNQGGIAVIVAVAFLVGGIPALISAGTSSVLRHPPRWPIRAGIFTATAVAVLATNYFAPEGWGPVLLRRYLSVLPQRRDRGDRKLRPWRELDGDRRRRGLLNPVTPPSTFPW